MKIISPLKKRYLSIFILVFVLFISITALNSHGVFKSSLYTQPEQEEIEVIEVITRITDLIGASNGTKTAFWNQFNLKDAPIIVTFDHEHLYLINPPPEVLFQRLGVVLRINTANVLYIDHDLWNLKSVQLHHRFPFYGKEAYVFRFEKSLEDPIIPFLNFVSERFHHYQETKFKNLNIPKEPYQNLFHLDNIALMQVEEMLLSEGLRVLHDPKSSLEIQKAHWQEVVALMKARRQLLSESSIAWEDYQQRRNGLADYVAMTVLFSMDSLSNFQPFHRLIESFHRSKIDEEILENVVKWRHYAVGSLLAMTLDHFEVPDWKEKIEEGESLFALLEEYLGSELVSHYRIEELKEENGYKQWHNQAREAVEGYRQDLEELEEDYSASKGVVFQLDVPHGIEVNESGISVYTYYTPEGRVIKISDTSHAVSSDLQWDFQSRSIPILFKSSSGAYEFKMERKSRLVLDGKEISLGKLFKGEGLIPFQTISWKCSSNDFKSNLPGNLIVKPNTVLIQFN